MANLSNINGKFVVEQTTGYVGIGNTDPAFPLEVKFASAELALNATAGSIYRVISTASDEFIINKNGVGDRLVISGGGDVGIGTSTPGTKLEVAGNLTIHNSSNAPYIDFVESGATSDSKARITMDQVDTDNGQLIFSTEGSGTLTERIRITAAGNVGIGYAYPDGYGTLLVSGTSALPILALRSSSGKVRQGFFEGGTGRFFLDTLNGSSGLSFVDGSTNTEKMRITSTGDVLINATSKFNGYPTTFKTQTLASDTGDYCPILELVGNRSAAVGNQNAMIQFYNKTSTAAEVGRISSIQSSATNSGELTFMTANAGTLAEKMRIASDGAVLVYPSTGSYGLSQNDVNQVMNSGYVAGSGTFVLTYTCASMSSMFIECVFNHYGYVTSYGCARVATFANGPSITIQDISVTTTGNGGSWSMARVSDTSFTVTKDAGTYAGAGYWYVKINGARVYSA